MESHLQLNINSYSMWVDGSDDYPLSYVFSYYVNDPVYQKVLKNKNNIAYTQALLSQGSPSNLNRVICVVTAIDSYGGASNVTNWVVVSPIHDKDVETASNNSFKNALLNKNTAAVNQIISAATNNLNIGNVNCKKINNAILLTE